MQRKIPHKMGEPTYQSAAGEDADHMPVAEVYSHHPKKYSRRCKIACGIALLVVVIVLCILLGLLLVNKQPHTDDTQSPDCPEGYVASALIGSCYKLYQTQYNYSEGAAICANDGAGIVAIESEAENDFLVAYLHTLTGNNDCNIIVKYWQVDCRFWTNGNNLENVEVWKWNGTNVVTYTNWNTPKEPDHLWQRYIAAAFLVQQNGTETITWMNHNLDEDYSMMWCLCEIPFRV